MAIKYRAAQGNGVEPPNPNLLPDIIAPGLNGGVAIPTAVETEDLVTAVGPLPTLTSSALLTTPAASTISNGSPSATSSAAPLHSGPSHGDRGLIHGALIAAIVVPIACLAIIIPILVLWYLDYRSKREAQRRARQRKSHEAMIQKHPFQEQPQGLPPRRPARTPPRRSTEQLQPETPIPHARSSLGLFNFELSIPSTPAGLMTPLPGLNEAQALQMRLSQASIVNLQARSSGGDVATRLPIDSEARYSANNIVDPPPPYVEQAVTVAPQAITTYAPHAVVLPAPAQTSYFAPLESIGTLQQNDRHRAETPLLGVPMDTTALHTPYASSEVLQLPDAYGQARTRSPSPGSSLERIYIRNGSNLTRPISYTAPERMSDVSGFSDDPMQWENDRLRHYSSGSSNVSPIEGGEDSFTIHPHHVL